MSKLGNWSAVMSQYVVMVFGIMFIMW